MKDNKHAGNTKNLKKVKRLQKEHWVVVGGIRNPFRVVGDIVEEC